MAILRMAAGLARWTPCGVWEAVHTYIERRAARVYERERRATLMMVPQALPPGTLLYDRRADGSVLELRIPELAQASNGAQEPTAGVCAVGLRASHLGPGDTGRRQIPAGPHAGLQE